MERASGPANPVAERLWAIEAGRQPGTGEDTAPAMVQGVSTGRHATRGLAANHTGSDARVYDLGARPPSRGCGLFIHASDDETADDGVARGDRVDFIAGLFERRQSIAGK